jgi:hypothetical protein
MGEREIKNIGEIQKADNFQRYLRSSSYLYSRAKLIGGIQVFLTVLVPVVLSVSSVVFFHGSQPGSGLKGWAAFYGIAVVLFDTLLLDRAQKTTKKAAAKIQEDFDCKLLEMPWNEFKVGDKPTPEEIDQSARALKRELTEREKSWYPPEAGRLPLYLCRVVCQRTNVWWDGELRRRYALCLSLLAVSVVVIAILVGMLKDMSLSTFVLTIMAPIFPAEIWFIRERNRQKDSIALLDRLMKHTAKLWASLLNSWPDEGEALIKSRELQDELFVHRYSNPPIPNMVHKIFAGKFDVTMNKGAEELVDAAEIAMRNVDN